MQHALFVFVMIVIIVMVVPYVAYVINTEEDSGKPLFLTPFLEAGEILKAQELSKVQPDIGGVKSHAGYLTVNAECESNLFFWFFPAQKNLDTAPLVLWLQGGPGLSGGIGLFEAIGPFSYDGEFKKRNHSLNVNNNLLFIDQPVGTGYSFTGKDCYDNSSSQAAGNLYSSLVQFFQMFPSLKGRKFVIAGESYAGHFIPSLGHLIHEKNPSSNIKINLTAMMIGNGLMDAYYQTRYANYFYYMGLVDDQQRVVGEKLHKMLTEYIDSEDWTNATETFKKILEFYSDSIGSVHPYNFLKNINHDQRQWVELIQLPAIRKSLHVGRHNFSLLSETVHKNFDMDKVKSVRPLIEKLLEHYPMLFYHGQLDTVCPYPLAVNFFRALNWTGSSHYQTAPRHQWCVDDQLAGYYKGSHNLYEVMVRNAGHSVLQDQPDWAFILAESITSRPTETPLDMITFCHTNNFTLDE